MPHEKKLDIIFAKLYIKFSLSLKLHDKEQLVLELLRYEIRVLVFNIVAKQLYLIISKFHGESRSKLDVIFRFLILSSKNLLLKKLRIFFPKYFDYARLQRDWSLSLLDSEDYSSLNYLLTEVLGKNSMSDLYKFSISGRLLIDHLVIKISNQLTYELFLTKKIPNSLLGMYTIDAFLCLSYIDFLYFYLIWRIRLSFILSSDKVAPYFFSFTKNGITLKYIVLNDLYYGNKLLSRNFSFVPSLKLFDSLVFLLLRFLARK